MSRVIPSLKLTEFFRTVLAGYDKRDHQDPYGFYIEAIKALLDHGIQAQYIEPHHKDECVERIEHVAAEGHDEAFYYFTTMYCLQVYEEFIEPGTSAAYEFEGNRSHFRFLIVCLFHSLDHLQLSYEPGHAPFGFSEDIFRAFIKMKTCSGGRWHPFANRLEGHFDGRIRIV